MANDSANCTAIEWTVEQVRLGQDNYNLVDVRTPEEYFGPLAHIPGSKLVTLGEELDRFLSTYPKNEQKTLVFVCRSGVRSLKATEQALQLGIKNAVNMKGGMIQWNDCGYPVEKGSL